MKKSVLAERIRGNERLQKEREEWEKERREIERSDRALKDRELTNVRTQFLQQSGTFASKDQLDLKFNALDNKVDALERTLISQLEQQGKAYANQLQTAIENINTQGTEGFRERLALETGRDQATKEILTNQATSRRWLIGVIVTVTFGILANLFTLAGLVFHIFKL